MSYNDLIKAINGLPKDAPELFVTMLIRTLRSTNSDISEAEARDLSKGSWKLLRSKLMEHRKQSQ